MTPPPEDPAIIKQRLAFLEEAAPVTPFVAAETEAGLVCVSTRDRGNKSRKLFAEGRIQLGDFDHAVAVMEAEGIRPSSAGRAFLDVGAHIGSAAILAVTRHAFARALAAEPEPENYRLLRANVVLTGLEREIETARVAISDGARTGRLALHPAKHGMHALEGPDGALGSLTGERAVEVEVVTLDELLARHALGASEVGLVKIDTQGHEPRVLRGAASLLREGVPLVIEYYPYGMADPGSELDSFEELIQDHYSRFLDLRDVRDGRLRPTAELSQLREPYQPPAATDLLVIR